MKDASKPRSAPKRATAPRKSRVTPAVEAAAESEPSYEGKRAEQLASGQPLAGYLVPDGFTADVTIWLRRDTAGDFDVCEHRITNMPQMPKLDDPAVAKTLTAIALREAEATAGPGWRLMTLDEVRAYLLDEKRKPTTKASKRRVH